MNGVEITSLSLSLLAVFSFFQVGLLVDFYLLSKCRLSFRPAIFLGLGIGVIGLGQLLLSIFKIYLNQTLALASFLLFLLPLVLDARLVKQLRIEMGHWPVKIRRSKANLFLIFALLLFLVFLIIPTFSHTVWGSDALTYWLFRARAYFSDGLVNRENLFPFWSHEQPILWPLTATWFYHFLGQSNEYWFQLVPLVILFNLIWFFYANLPPIRSWQRFLFTQVLFLTPFLWQNVALGEYVGNADLLASFYLLLAIVLIIKKSFNLAALFLFFASITKFDVLPAVLGFLFLLPIFNFFLHQPWQDTKKIWIATFGLLLLFWLWNQSITPGNQYFSSLQSLNFSQRPFLSYMWYTVNAFREEFRQVYRWGLGWWLIFFLGALNLPQVFPKANYLLAFSLIICQFMGYFVVYYISPENQASQIATSIFRLVLQVYPASLFLVSYLSYNKKLR